MYETKRDRRSKMLLIDEFISADKNKFSPRIQFENLKMFQQRLSDSDNIKKFVVQFDKEAIKRE